MSRIDLTREGLQRILRDQTYAHMTTPKKDKKEKEKGVKAAPPIPKLDKSKPSSAEMPLEYLKSNWQAFMKYTSIMLYGVEGYLAGIIVSSSTEEPIPAWLRIVWHLGIAAAALLMALLFAPMTEKMVNFINTSKYYYKAFKRSIVTFAYLFVVLLTFFTSFITPALTFLMIAALTETISLVNMAMQAYGPFNILGWFDILQGHNAVVSTYLGTVFHYGLLLIIIVSEFFRLKPDFDPTMIPVNVKKKEDDKKEEKKEEDDKEDDTRRNPRDRRKRQRERKESEGKG